MTPEQRTRLTELLPLMRKNARRKVSQNDYAKAFRMIDDLEQALIGNHGPDAWSPEQWLAYAEVAAEGADKPGTIRMTMAQVLSGMPPEHKED